MRKITFDVMSYDELCPQAQARAREQALADVDESPEWEDEVLETAARLAECVGIYPARLPSMATEGRPDMDVDCTGEFRFNGIVRDAEAWGTALDEHAPDSTEMYGVGEALEAIQGCGLAGFAVRVVPRLGKGVDIRPLHPVTETASIELTARVGEAVRMFGEIVTRMLDAERDHHRSPDCLADGLREEGEVFLADGTVWRGK